MLPNHISSLLKQKSLSLSHTASLTHSFYLSKLIKPKTHTHTWVRGNHSLTSLPRIPPSHINPKSIHNQFCKDPDNQILLGLIGDLS